MFFLEKLQKVLVDLDLDRSSLLGKRGTSVLFGWSPLAALAAGLRRILLAWLVNGLLEFIF